jgi:branched-chain amino acid transport system ATP-binding protein
MALLEVENISVTLGGVPILREVSSLWSRSALSPFWCQQGGQDHPVARHFRHLSAWAGRFDGAPIHGQPAHRIVQSGLSHAPEGRQIFSSMTVRENLQLGAGAQRTGSGSWPLCMTSFPSCSSAATAGRHAVRWRTAML